MSTRRLFAAALAAFAVVLPAGLSVAAAPEPPVLRLGLIPKPVNVSDLVWQPGRPVPTVASR